MVRQSSRLIAVTAAVVTGLAINVTQAAAPRLPSAMYPVGAHISYRPAISNSAMDCLWGFFCEGHSPLFHFQTESELKRTGGWGQFAAVRVHGRTAMAFELFASQYGEGDSAGKPWARAAFADFCMAIQSHGYGVSRTHADLLPPGSTGGWTVQLQPSGSSDLIVVAAWTGRREVEAIVLFDHRPAAIRTRVTSLLIHQVREALVAGS